MDETSTLRATLKTIDAVIETQYEAIKRGEDLKILMNDSRFKRVILDGYIETEAKRLFDILTDPSGASAYTAAEIHLKLEAISHFKGYVGTADFAGTVKMDAESAPLKIMREENFRKEVTATADRSGE